MEKVVLPFKLPTKDNILKLKGILANLIEEVPIQIQLQQELAKITKAKYDALVEQGFTPDQAIQLCR